MSTHSTFPRPVGGYPPRSLLGSLAPATRQRLLRLGTLQQIAAGETIIIEGATHPIEVFLLLQGSVKVTSSTEDGHTILLSIRGAGEVVGELAALDGSPRLATVSTVRPCVVRRIGPREFRRFLDENPDADRAVTRTVTGKLRNATWHRVENGSPVPTRVARSLLMLARVHGRPSPEGTVIPDVTHPDMAGLVNASERTVQKALAELRHSGVISQGYKKIIIRDWQALRSFTGITQIPPEYGVD